MRTIHCADVVLVCVSGNWRWAIAHVDRPALLPTVCIQGVQDTRQVYWSDSFHITSCPAADLLCVDSPAVITTIWTRRLSHSWLASDLTRWHFIRLFANILSICLFSSAHGHRAAGSLLFILKSACLAKPHHTHV